MAKSPLSILIDGIDPNIRAQMLYYNFKCVTEHGVSFKTSMLGMSQGHAYKRLRAQTEGSILIAPWVND